MNISFSDQVRIDSNMTNEVVVCLKHPYFGPF